MMAKSRSQRRLDAPVAGRYDARMAKRQGSAEKRLSEAFEALEAELDKLVPKSASATGAAAEKARAALAASLARLREAVGPL
jgi:ElaB/YqjD/DUF883 family membrane-anchored ribosome-binding protein